MTTPITSYVQDPDERLDYLWDWSAWLTEGDTITAHEVTVAHGSVEVDETSADDTTVKAWIKGGEDGENAQVRARVTTAAGRVHDWTIVLMIREH